MTVVLLGNYLPDQQESMRRFALAMAARYRELGIEVVHLVPQALFRGGSWTESRFGKWLGYLDKYLIFPWRLRAFLTALRRQGKDVVLQVCDHSNALYLLFTRQVPSLVVCHDVLAITAAMGDYPLRPTQWSGRILQRAILAGLNRADHVVCVSQNTASSLRTLCGFGWDRISVVYGGWMHGCAPATPEVVRAVKERHGLPERYLLHIGGNAWYKNRPGVVEIYAALRRRRPDAPPLVMAGKIPDATVDDAFYRREKDLRGQVFCVTDFDDEILSALYTGAEALLFPSLEEGFGLPLPEAMACGCRVVTSNRPPMSVVTGGHALIGNPGDVEGMARLVERLLDEGPEERRERSERGIAYVRQVFGAEEAGELYADLCRRLLRRTAPVADGTGKAGA